MQSLAHHFVHLKQISTDYRQGHITTGLEQWQYVFLIFGAVSIAWAIVFLVFMPDLPSTAKFLTPEERVIAVERVAVSRQGVKNKTFKKYQAWQFFRDPKARQILHKDFRLTDVGLTRV